MLSSIILVSILLTCSVVAENSLLSHSKNDYIANPKFGLPIANQKFPSNDDDRIKKGLKNETCNTTSNTQKVNTKNDGKTDFRKIMIPRYNNVTTVWGENLTNVPNSPLAAKQSFISANTGPVPDYFDWRDKNMVSPVKNQEQCNSCWAFSVVANVESYMKIYKNREMVLSEQFLIDCDTARGGCEQGASALEVFGDLVTKIGGVLEENDYPPYSAQQKKCRYKGAPPYPVPVVGMHRVPKDEKAMVHYLYKYGPITAAINSKSMDKYTDSYIDEPTDEECPPNKLDHVVLIVGYNVYVNKATQQRVPYWIIKNSWGSRWGDSGFYYLVRGRNACGIASDVSFPYVT